MEGSIIGSATAISGVLVRITYRQWAHILENHDYMAGNLDIVLETLSEPDFITKGWKDELIALRHYPKTNITIPKQISPKRVLLWFTKSCQKITMALLSLLF